MLNINIYSNPAPVNIYPALLSIIILDRSFTTVVGFKDLHLHFTEIFPVTSSSVLTVSHFSPFQVLSFYLSIHFKYSPFSFVEDD